MKIFLTGKNGGIGSSILDLLLHSNIDVVSPSSNELDLGSDFCAEYENDVFDGIIHCAGINNVKPYDQVSKNEFIKLFNINTLSFLKLCSTLKFNNGANVIAIGSLYTTDTKEGRIQYTMSKHALWGAVKTLAMEMADNSIKVNMISPGFVQTAMTMGNNSEERIHFLNNNIPLGMTKPEDIAKTCLFLLENNNAITGQNIIIDGGYSLKGL